MSFFAASRLVLEMLQLDGSLLQHLPQELRCDRVVQPRARAQRLGSLQVPHKNTNQFTAEVASLVICERLRRHLIMYVFVLYSVYLSVST